mmetsp:Transcript_89671/g.239636  ORF Transcript_89671/g.239636 Transcript_89671/m.239636 type:complete len:256 (+) Transcript_89671:5-772(+)
MNFFGLVLCIVICTQSISSTYSDSTGSILKQFTSRCLKYFSSNKCAQMEEEPLPQRPQFRKSAGYESSSLRTAHAAETGVSALTNNACSMKADEELDAPNTEVTRPGSSPVVPVQYEYLDHTADVQFHSWGSSLEEALEQMVVCMFSYITELEKVEELGEPIIVEVSGHDMESLVYALLDEFLFRFSVDGFVVRRVQLLQLDRQGFRARACGHGETFQPRTKHPQGTEIKAITYSAMQVVEAGAEPAHVLVIVDI